MGEDVLAHELPELFDGIEFQAVGRQGEKSDVGGHDEDVADVSGHRIATSARILDTYVVRNQGDAVLKLPARNGRGPKKS